MHMLKPLRAGGPRAGSGAEDPTGLAPLTLVLGGARSGKSRFGERLLSGFPGHRIYLATAEPGDAEMRARIAEHRARRGDSWSTVEEPLALAERLAELSLPGTAVLVDCLTLWLANLLGAGRDPQADGRRLEEALLRLRGPVVFVSNEVGLGIVPDNALARRFRDEAGRLNQRMAASCQRVHFLAAGLPVTLKDEMPFAIKGNHRDTEAQRQC
jgi:adenosylcobinamide kinase/adenosylcobinamide-phosphate guanylyltransferase